MARVATKKSARKGVARNKGTATKPVRKAAVRKTAVKKSAVRRPAAKKAAARKAAAATSAIREAMPKARLTVALSEATGLTRQDVGAVLAALSNLVERHIKKRGAGQFTLPGLLKIRTVKRKATKARKGRNPFTGEEIMIAAKPARTTVKVTPLKGLKEMAER